MRMLIQLIFSFTAISLAPLAAQTTFTQWEALYPSLTDLSPTDTPENDGVPTLLKYLYNIDPTVPMTASSRAALPIVGISGSNLTLTFRQYASETGITINVQTSSDLQSWATVVATDVTQIGTDANTGDPIMQAQVPMTGTKEFICVNVVYGATSISSVPEGVMTFNLLATGASQNGTSYLSLPLTADPVYTGVTSSVTANTISVADVPSPWTAGQFTVAGAPYFVRFLTGAETGRTVSVTANTANSLTLDTTDGTTQTTALTTSGFSVAVGDSFEVFAGTTLASVFGNNSGPSPLLLNGSTGPFTADTVSIYSALLARFTSYYFNTTAGYWEASGSSVNANNTVFPNHPVFTITRRQNESASSFSFTGRVAEVALLTKTTGSSSVIYSTTQYPIGMTLSQLQLGANWTKSLSVVTADTVSIWDYPLFRYDTYYQLPDSTWRKVGYPNTDVSSFVIPAGTLVAILKRSAVSGATSFLSSVLPYTLNLN